MASACAAGLLTTEAPISSKEKAFQAGRLYPCLTDRFDEMGSASGHSFHRDLLVARLIYQANPVRHIDVCSIDGFVAHLAALGVEVFDIRSLPIDAKGITFLQMDIMQPNDELADCTDSLSCLHVLKHFGLGRCGNPIDYEGHRKGIFELRKSARNSVPDTSVKARRTSM
jgi:hypothetical protein